MSMLGLVLAGGGAKGAYQLGAIEYLSDRGFVPEMVAGTSIGALNAAVLLSEVTFEQGVRRLGALWERLGRETVIRADPRMLQRALFYGALLFMPNLRTKVAGMGIRAADRLSLLDVGPIERILGEVLNVPCIRSNRVEAWVAAFPSLDWTVIDPGFLGDLVAKAMGVDAHWFRLQDIQDDEELRDVLLASAAFPIAFPRRTVRDTLYVDGGLADNVPLAALEARGCTTAFVVHLENGATWDRQRHPGIQVIEIRPQLGIQTTQTPLLGWIDSLLDFSQERIAVLRQRGRDDARAAIEPILATLGAVRQMRESASAREQAVRELENDGPLGEGLGVRRS
jgi:NTE family protein